MRDIYVIMGRILGMFGPVTLPATTRGLSLVEVMNFVALAAVLSAVGMFGLARYVRHAKTAEAVESVTRLAAESVTFYEASAATQPAGAAPQAVQAMRHFPPSSRVPVPEDPLAVRGQRYQSNAADWAGSPWRELRFSMIQAQHYQYSYESEGTGAQAKATVRAQGDLDGDGRRSLFELTVAPDASLTAKVADAMTRRDPEE